jgi:serine/threonine protein kinase
MLHSINLLPTLSGNAKEKVIVKTAFKSRLDNERKFLKIFLGKPGIRQLLDEIEEPRCLILKYFDDNLLEASNAQRLKKAEIKRCTRKILEALKMMHERGYVHTG